MKIAGGIVFMPHTKAEAVQWDCREGRGEAFGDGNAVSVVRRSDLDALLGVLAAARAMRNPSPALESAVAVFDAACGEELVSSGS